MTASIKTAVRFFLRKKQYTVLNVAGLAIGLGCFLLMLSYVVHERSFDSMHPFADRIYEINGIIPLGSDVLENAVVGAPLGPAAQEAVPEIEASVRLQRLYDIPIRVEDRDFKEKRIFAADPACLLMFRIPLRKGNPAAALEAPFSAVLDETSSRKYFGSHDPVGRTLQIFLDKPYDFQVTGVMADLPSNTIIRVPVLISFSTLLQTRGEAMTRWQAWGSTTTFVRLRPGADPLAAGEKITSLARSRLPNDQRRASYQLQPLRSIYLTTRSINNELEGSGSPSRVRLFLIIGFLILAAAILNFINLTTAKASHRLKEVGVRKACGGGRASLVRQFLGESIFLSAAATILGLTLFRLFKSVLDTYLAKSLNLNIFPLIVVLAVLPVLVIAVGAAAGIYPALVLSRVPAAAAFRSGGGAMASKARLRGVLVVSQFFVSVVLITGILIMVKQVRFVEGKDLGFKKDGLIVLRNREARTLRNGPALKMEIQRQTAISGVSLLASMPSGQNRNISEFRVETWPLDKKQWAQTLAVDEDFVPVMGLTVASGRSFGPNRAADADAVLVNETAVKTFGLDAPVGTRLFDGDRALQIIGVVKDWHTNSLHSPIYPVVIMPSGEDAGAILARIPASDSAAAIGRIEAAWNRVLPGRPFDYSFLEDILLQDYQRERRLVWLMIFFCGMAVFISCLGVFGLAAFGAEQRRKEISIRKVLGADFPNLTFLLTKSYVRWAGAAVILGWPVAYFVAHKWLEGFAYRTSVGFWPFLLSGGLALVVALGSVSFQTIRAALADPVVSLKYE